MSPFSISRAREGAMLSGSVRPSVLAIPPERCGPAPRRCAHAAAWVEWAGSPRKGPRHRGFQDHEHGWVAGEAFTVVRGGGCRGRRDLSGDREAGQRGPDVEPVRWDVGNRGYLHLG